jgi:hypothetical protein
MLAFPHTHAWSCRQKAIIIGITLVVLSAFVALAYSYDRSHRVPDESILVGTWEMTSPPTPGSYTLLRLDGDRGSHWHSGLWIRRDINDRDGRGVELGASEMSWYAGGSYIHMRLVDDPLPQIWQIVDARPEELRLCHAKHDYVFKRSPDASNRAMQRTASEPATDLVSICHRRLGCESRFTGLAVADLLSR